MSSADRPTFHLSSPTTLSALVLVAVFSAGLVLDSSPGWTSDEMSFLRSVSSLHTGELDRVALWLDWLFSPPVASVLILGNMAVIAYAYRRLTPAVHFLVIVAVPWLGSEVVKIVVHRARPDISSLPNQLVLEPGGLSFPSGHTTFAACLMIGVIVLARRTRWRTILITSGAVVAVATASSRVYLGVHYPSDVAAALVYSVAAVALVNALWMRLVVSHWDERRTAADETAPYQGAKNVR